jgi:hypothetical protein
MCYILVSTCPACSFPLQTQLRQCGHAELHGFDPRACPNRMKRRKQSDARVCWKCVARKGSLSCFPGGEVYDADDESEEGGVLAAGRERKGGRMAMKRRKHGDV